MPAHERVFASQRVINKTDFGFRQYGAVVDLLRVANDIDIDIEFVITAIARYMSVH